MKCDRCNNEATVHETLIKDGVPVEKNLCESCAAHSGVVKTSNAENILDSETAKLQLLKVKDPQRTPQVRVIACPHCKLTAAEFRQTGLLGCPHCYQAFGMHLAGLIERAHEGAMRHMGKRPGRAGNNQDKLLQLQERAERMRRLHSQLDEAVASEQYEQAARLRDEIRRVSEAAGN